MPRLGMTISALVVSFVMGWLAKGEWQLNHTYTLHDVHVLRKYDDYNFRVQVEDGLPVTLRFCTSYKPQFGPGMTLSLLVYEDTGGCKSIDDSRLGYTVKRDSTTGRELLTEFKQEN